jgi:hypothetical protein
MPHNMRRLVTFLRTVGILCISLVLIVAFAPRSKADSPISTLTILGGVLTEAALALPAVSLTTNGSNQQATYQLAISVIDATGSGQGWHLTITSTQYTVALNPSVTLPTNASSITAVSAVCVTLCTNPTNSVTYPLTIPAGAVAPAPVVFYSAASSSGLGAFTVTPNVSINVPGNAMTGIYTSTLTLAIVSGP